MLVLFSLLFCLQDPLAGQLPKADLGVDAFLVRHPDYDGRGVRVAVLDTGVDPGHPFLQKTSQGSRKLVDWYDATSDGYLNTGTAAEVRDGRLMGLSGRRLELGRWAGHGSYHLGRLDADFLPGGLRARIRADREEEWREDKRRRQEERLRRQPQGTNGVEPTLEEAERERRWEKFADPGPVYDVVVFRDRESWRVVIDSDEDGDLGEEEALRPFRESGDWAVLGDEALLNYAVDVLDDGRRTVLFFDSNGHGTHVAGIIGSYQGEGARLNGIAPGVELVAIKIGDGKYGAATSGFSIAKALDYAVESGCQVVNMSFGGPSFFADGREPDAWVIDEATRRGLIVVTSAGNEGPTLSTVGAPATATSAFAIAAAVWPDTQRVNYGSLDPSDPVLFDFSSRGPLPNGSLGVDFTAPGAAVSALPSWLITPAENFNGTSMAAPQAAGCIALLLAAAAAEELPASPARVYRALRLSAAPLDRHHWVEQGHGVIRALPALEALRDLASLGPEETRFEIEVANPFGVGRGIYERDLPSIEAFGRSISLSPQFPDGTTNAQKAAFFRTFRVRSEAPWVMVPEAVYTSASGRSFTARVDASHLGVGLHSSRILLYDAAKPESAGPDLVVPVTVVVPVETYPTGDHRFRKSLVLDPGELDRSFLRVPYGARHAKIRFTQVGPGRNEYRTGAGSVSGFRYSGDRQKRGRFFLESGETAEETVPVEAGTVLEFAIGSRWSVNQSALLDLEVEFLGIQPQSDEWVAPAGQGLAYLALKSLLRRESATVSASLDGIARPILGEAEIVPDPIRATVFGGRGMFYARLEWPLEVAEDGTAVSLHMPRSIQTTELREDLMVEVVDRNQRVVKRTIAYEVLTDLGSLDQGSYLVRLLYPSLGQETLQAAYAGAELRIAAKLDAPTLYASLDDAVTRQHATTRITLPYGGARTLVLDLPELKELHSGAYYYGTARFARGDDTLLQIPIRVERPGNGGPVEASAAVESAGREEEEAYRELAGQETSTATELLAKARAWAEAAPYDPDAALAVLQVLSEAGLQDLARADARGFLGRFPHRATQFLSAAESWNP